MKKFSLSAALVAAFFCASAASAAVTFGASVTNANGALSTVLAWNAPGASGCTASGHASWSGAKQASGTLALPAITLSGSYTLTLSCSFPGNASTMVSWVAPTKNTDGSPLTNLSGFKVLYGNSATALTLTKIVNSATAMSADMGALAAGNWFFAVRAVNALGVESDNSAPLATKTVSLSVSENSSVTLTVNPIPAAPSSVEVS